jgi:NAD(P)-dependent dehydrogenase (short-subunit alcohol dehydrogenase family)
MKIKNSIVLVSGTNRGIGKALVGALLAGGAQRVYAGMRDLAKSEGLFADARVVPLQLDITEESSLQKAAAQARDVTLLINNAGVLDFGSVLEAPKAAFERNFGTNFYGLWNAARVFAPVLEGNGGGGMVNLLTIVALASMPGLGVYNASKAAAWSLTQSLRVGLAPRGIHVHGVFPGAIDTDMIASVDLPKTSPDAVAKAIVDGIDRDIEDIFPDPMSTSLYEVWRTDHKKLERQLATM